MPEPALQVREYFAKQAATYDKSSRRGLWAFLRALETPAVMQLAGIQPGEVVLDAGSGSGHYTHALHNAGARVTALDIEPAMLESLQRTLHVETVLGDLLTLQLEPKFDKIICAGVLEFVADPTAAVVNLAKALRPDGPRTIVILVVARSLGGLGYWLTRRTNGINMPLFTRRKLDALAAAAGLHVEAAVRAGYNWVARLTPVK